MIKIHNTVYPQGFVFWHPKSEGGAFPYFPCTGDFEFSLKVPIWIFLLYVGLVLWCVGTLRFSNLPMCVCSVLYCGETLSFSKSPVCGLCVVVSGGFDFFQTSSVCGQFVLWCVRTLSFSKFLYVWALCCDVWGLCVSQFLLCVNTLWTLFIVWKREKILQIFKGSAFPYRVENAFPWVGGIL